MSLYEKIFGKAKQPTALESFKMLTTYRPAFTSWGGEIYESELVRSAIDARARHVSKLKVDFLGAANPRLRERLKKRPNDFQTWSQFLYRTSTILDCTNTVFIVPVIEAGIISGYFPLVPQKCEVKEYNGTVWLRYQFAENQIAAVEFSKCIVLTKFQYKNDIFGESNGALNDTMKLVNIQNQGIQEAVRNSATYRFMAQLANFAKPEDLAKERKLFTRHNLATNAESGGLLLFPNTYKDIRQIESNPFTIDAAQMDLIQRNVFNYFGVNDDVLQNKAYGDAWSAFYEGAIEPFAIQFSEAFTKCIYTDRERAQGSEVILSANRLMYMSNADKLNMSTQLADRGILSINEIREMWNLEPVEGGEMRPIRGEYYDANEKEDAE